MPSTRKPTRYHDAALNPMRAVQPVVVPQIHHEIRSEVDGAQVLANNDTTGAKPSIQDAEAGVPRRGSSRSSSAEIPTPTLSPSADHLRGILSRLATDLAIAPANAHLPHERHADEIFSSLSQLSIAGTAFSSDRISAQPTQPSTFFQNASNVDARGATIIGIGRDQVIHNGNCTFIDKKPTDHMPLFDSRFLSV